MRVTRVLTQKAKEVGFREWLARFLYDGHGFRKYGLWYHDCFYHTPEVVEAISRLPPDIVDERNHRILRAIQLNIERKKLPKHEWTKFEDDVRYLDPYLKQVKQEFAEKREWYKQ